LPPHAAPAQSQSSPSAESPQTAPANYSQLPTHPQG
jgi:hypothetical protein